MSLSSSRDIIQFGDIYGNIIFKNFQDMPKVNRSSSEIEYCDYVEPQNIHISENE
jgi:hypothetical protein